VNWSVTSLESSSVSTHNSRILNITHVSFRHVLSGDRPIPGDQHPFPKIAYKTQGRDDVPERIGAAKRSSGDGDGHFYTSTSLKYSPFPFYFTHVKFNSLQVFPHSSGGHRPLSPGLSAVPYVSRVFPRNNISYQNSYILSHRHAADIVLKTRPKFRCHALL